MLINCNALHIPLADCSVQMCVTSPPYYGLRDYGVSNQLGLEPTPDEYVANMVLVFREVKRVLRDDGTLWLNIGDSYFSDTKGTGGTKKSGLNAKRAEDGSLHPDRKSQPTNDGYRLSAGGTGCKPKDLIGIPWMLAFALRADGWWLRQDIIWAKPNPMPESVTDRPTKSHEYMFLLAKSARYYYDNEAIKEPCAATSVSRLAQNIENQIGTTRANGGRKSNGNLKAVGDPTSGRNKRSVWTVTTKPYSGAHFATFPPDLIEPCILAGSKAGDVVLDPFVGSGTTVMVARKHNRQGIGLDLSLDYLHDQASKRIAKVQPKMM
jgi:DNA modification methylase